MSKKYSTMKQQLSEKIKLVRKAAGLSQRNFSDMLGTNQNTVCYWETGRFKPSKKFMNKLFLMGSEFGIEFEIEDFLDGGM